MKSFRLLAALVAASAVFGSLYGGSVTAMPIRLAFEGTVIEPRTVDDEAVYISGGGIFAPGQAVTGSVLYDPSSLFSSDGFGDGMIHYGVVGEFGFSIAALGGAYESSFSGGTAIACQGPFMNCSLLGPEDLYDLISIGISPLPIGPPVNGLEMRLFQLAFIGENLLASNALLSSAEIVSLIDQTPEILFVLSFNGDLICEGFTCIRETFSVQAIIERISVVPEPASLGLMLIGLAAMVRRKRTA